MFGSERFAATLFLVCGAAPVCNAFIPGQGSNMSRLERDAFRRNRKGDSFFCANQIHHSGR
ncbi:hypothetical protein BMJ25_17070 [Sinorhizobium medicae]|nr:hypothetical protein BMJ25_17070 [Sinorhizobium medicae]